MKITQNWHITPLEAHLPSAIKKWLYCEQVLNNRTGRPNLMGHHIFFDDGLPSQFYPDSRAILRLQTINSTNIEGLEENSYSKILQSFANLNAFPSHPVNKNAKTEFDCLITSSFRSLFIYSNDSYTILKCSLPYRIGELERNILSKDLKHSIALSKHLKALKYPGAYFDESSGIINNETDQAVIERTIPFNRNNCFWCPVFAIFKDNLDINEASIIDKIFLNQNKKIEDFIFEDFIFPMISYLYDLVFNYDVSPGAHAQNLLIEVNDLAFKFERFCFRDFGDTHCLKLDKRKFLDELSILNSTYLNNTTLWYLENWAQKNNGPSEEIIKDMVNTIWSHLCQKDYNAIPPIDEIKGLVELSGFYQSFKL